jgi:hypothetical protein
MRTVLQRKGQSSADSRLGGPTSKSDENVGKARTLLRDLTVRTSAEALNINRQTAWLILTENSELKKVCVKDSGQRTSSTALSVKELENTPFTHQI